jgi:hypothetical protein
MNITIFHKYASMKFKVLSIKNIHPAGKKMDTHIREAGGGVQMHAKKLKLPEKLTGLANECWQVILYNFVFTN